VGNCKSPAIWFSWTQSATRVGEGSVKGVTLSMQLYMPWICWFVQRTPLTVDMYGKITLLETSFSLTGWERVAFKQSMPESVYWIVQGRACVPNHAARWKQVIIFILAAWIHHCMEAKLPVCSVLSGCHSHSWYGNRRRKCFFCHDLKPPPSSQCFIWYMVNSTLQNPSPCVVLLKRIYFYYQ